MKIKSSTHLPLIVLLIGLAVIYGAISPKTVDAENENVHVSLDLDEAVPRDGDFYSFDFVGDEPLTARHCAHFAGFHDFRSFSDSITWSHPNELNKGSFSMDITVEEETEVLSTDTTLLQGAWFFVISPPPEHICINPAVIKAQDYSQHTSILPDEITHTSFPNLSHRFAAARLLFPSTGDGTTGPNVELGGCQ
jgi:hypothetical protein